MKRITFLISRRARGSLKTCGSVIGLLAILFGAGLISSQAQNTWTEKADFEGTSRSGAVGFSIDTSGYMGTGYNGSYTKDFWEYDPIANTWTQKADFGGSARTEAVGFSLGSKGFIGTGEAGYHAYKNDFWEYDPAANTWSQKADFGGSARSEAVGFSIGNNGYIGTGSNYEGGDNYYKDFWEYDPAANTWTQQTNFGGSARTEAVGFSIGNKGYIGTGRKDYGPSESISTRSFWEYDPDANMWTKKAAFGGDERSSATGFSIGNKGYIGTGYNDDFWFGPLIHYGDFWEYDPDTDTWTRKADLGGVARYHATGFSIGNKGYIGTGYNWGYKNDFWGYTPDSSSCSVPADLAVTNITSSSATLKWYTAGVAEGYKVRYKVSGTSEWTHHKITTGKSRQLNNLSSNTSYTWQVKTYCSVNPGVSSDWSAKEEFTTESLRLGDEFVGQISFQIYPNPASHKIVITFQSNAKGELQILNLVGQIVFSKEINSTTEEIDVSKFQNGIYLITVATSIHKIESKFLKQ